MQIDFCLTKYSSADALEFDDKYNSQFLEKYSGCDALKSLMVS